MSGTFLSAEWRKLVMANYIVEPEILQDYIPPYTRLDLFKGNCYVSLVGFMFMNTRLLGIKVPFHIHFEEVNLRFYVTHTDKGLEKRGVVFIKEIVPKPAISLVANTLYREHYETRPMKHDWKPEKDQLTVSYSWKKAGRWNDFRITTDPHSHTIAEGSEKEFITEHYWGYTKASDSVTSEYGVEHPRWQVYTTQDYRIDVDFGANYGSRFAFLNNTEPVSVFLAEGSDIQVKMKRRKIRG